MKLNQKHTIKKREVHSITKLKRRKYHHLMHKIHYKHKLSLRTLSYMKEYGPHTHVAHVIVRESIKILLLASIISSLGGIHLGSIRGELVTILPLLILLPALTGLIGSFGTVVSSKFTTMLFLGKIKGKWWESEEVHGLVYTILAIAIIAAFYIGSLSSIIALMNGFPLTIATFLKILTISLVATASLVGIIMVISIAGGLLIFRKKEDPNNFLIPITTSVADLGSLLLFSLLVAVFF